MKGLFPYDRDIRHKRANLILHFFAHLRLNILIDCIHIQNLCINSYNYNQTNLTVFLKTKPALNLEKV